MYEMTTILRQRDALSFAEALNRLRTGDHTLCDLELFKRFEIDPLNPSQNYFVFLRHIFATHCQRDEHNDKVLGAVETDESRVENLQRCSSGRFRFAKRLRLFPAES
jgi:hypothetical protein